MCKNTFIEKTLARPDIAFSSFTADGERRITLEAGTSLKAIRRSGAPLPKTLSLFYEISGSRAEKILTGVLPASSENRAYRAQIKDIHLCKRQKDYRILARTGDRVRRSRLFSERHLSGSRPLRHDKKRSRRLQYSPAKKEARFRDIASLHHGVRIFANFFHQYDPARNEKRPRRYN